MKRLLILVACLFAFAAVGATASRGDTPNWTLHMTAAPDVLATDAATTLSGTLSTTTERSVADQAIELLAYDNATCAGDPVQYIGEQVTGNDGDFSFHIFLVNPAPKQGWFQAEAWDGESLLATSECVSVKWTDETVQPVEPTEPAEPAVPAIASTYLCWNHEMTDPVAYEDAVADTMWATGTYFEPQAILGNVVGGTNIGACHRVCNAPSTRKPTGYGLGGSGGVSAPSEMTAYHS